MQDWTHQRCGKTFSVPFDGAKNIPCEGCGVNVTMPKYGTTKATRGRKNLSKRVIAKNDWGDLQPIVNKRFEEHKTVVHRVNQIHGLAVGLVRR